MVGRLFMVSRLMMLGGFPVVMRGTRKVLWRLLVVFGSLLRHVISSVEGSNFQQNRRR